MKITLEEFRKKIELSFVNQYLCTKEVNKLCLDAKRFHIGVVCVNPFYVKYVKNFLMDTDINVSVNVGFPFGLNLTEVKVLEAKKAIEDGANQIDMVINIGALKSNNYEFVYNDIKEIVDVSKGMIVKTIIETWVLSDEEKIQACKIAEAAGASMVKTTTGVKTQYLNQYNSSAKGATVEDIKLMRRILSPNIKIKASGGVYNLNSAMEILKAGADQLGVSKGTSLINEFRATYGNQCII